MGELFFEKHCHLERGREVVLMGQNHDGSGNYCPHLFF